MRGYGVANTSNRELLSWADWEIIDVISHQ